MTEPEQAREIKHYPYHKKIYTTHGPLLIPFELPLSEVPIIDGKLRAEYGQIWHDSGKPATGCNHQMAFYRIIPRGLTANTPRQAMREIMIAFNPVFSY